MSHIYILYHIGNQNKNVKEKIVKIGSTQNLRSRMCNYKTCYNYFDNEHCELTKITIRESTFTCYEIDKIINILSKKYAYPFKYSNGTGGTEFYKIINILSKKYAYPFKYSNGTGGTEFYKINNTNRLERLLKELNIEYELTELDVNEFMKTCIKVDYKSLDKDDTMMNMIDMDKIHKIINSEKIKLLVKTKEIKLYNWQKVCLEDYNKFMNENDKTGVIIAPTGVGKKFYNALYGN